MDRKVIDVSFFLSLSLTIYLPTYLSTYVSIDLSTHLSMYLSIDLSIYRPSGEYFSTLRSHKSLEKHSVSRLSYLFTHLHPLSSDSFSSTLLSSNLSLLSASSLLCFSSVHIVGSLTSKLPSINQI